MLRTWIALNKKTEQSITFETEADFADVMFLFESMQCIKHGQGHIAWTLDYKATLKQAISIAPELCLHRGRRATANKLYAMCQALFAKPAWRAYVTAKLNKLDKDFAIQVAKLLSKAHARDFQGAWDIFQLKLTYQQKCYVLSIL